MPPGTISIFGRAKVQETSSAEHRARGRSAEMLAGAAESVRRIANASLLQPRYLNRIRYEDPERCANVSTLSETASNSLSHASCNGVDLPPPPPPRCDAHIDEGRASRRSRACAYLHTCIRTRCKYTCACFASNFVEPRELFLGKTLRIFRFRLYLSLVSLFFSVFLRCLTLSSKLRSKMALRKKCCQQMCVLVTCYIVFLENGNFILSAQRRI